MSEPLVTIVIPYSYSVKWLQILLYSMAICGANPGRTKVIVMDNTPGKETLQWMPTPCNRMPWVTVIKATHPQDWHAGCMDYALPMIDTPYFMMMESDCQVCASGWLDNFLNAVEKDDLVAMAGWFWDTPMGDRNYIGPGATIYNTAIVKQIAEEVKRNKQITFCYGDGMKRRHTLEPRLAEMVEKGQWGPFSETRGYHDRVCRDDKWWQEPCAWLYYRCASEFECVRLPGTFINEPFEGISIAAGTFYGAPEKEVYLAHFWGGTVSHNWEKQKVSAPWELVALPWWIQREDRIWNDVVPEKIRKRTLEMGLVKTGDEELEFIMNHRNVKGE